MSTTLEPPEVIMVEDKVVAYDGGEGPLGHPRVFLNMGDEGRVECPYCDRLFILKGGPADHSSSQQVSSAA